MKFGMKILFHSFSAYLNPICIENNARMMFYNFFKIFLLFFWNFLARVGLEGIRGEIFFLFLGLSQPGLDGNNDRMMFFNFFEFFCYFFWNFLARVG